MEEMRGKWASSCVDFGYTELFCIPKLTSVFMSFCDSVPGTLWCSIKKIEVPYVFDSENGIALHAMQGNRASFPSEGDVSYDFRIAAATWGIFSSYSVDGHSKLHFVQRSQDSFVVMRDTSGI